MTETKGQVIAFEVLTAFCLLISGASVGWLIGLSGVPVIQGVITALVGIIVAVAGLYAGTATPVAGATPLPHRIAPLLAGLAIGATVATSCRTNDTFGVDTAAFKARLTKAGLSEEDATKVVGEQLKSVYGQVANADPLKAGAGKLFAGIPKDFCKQYGGLKGQELVVAMKSSGTASFSKLAEKYKEHPEYLEDFVEALCQQ